MPNEPSSGLSDVLEAVTRRWLTLVVIAVVVFLGSIVYASTAAKAYTATAVVALTPRTTGTATATDVTQLGQKYVAYVTSASISDSVGTSVGVSGSDLQQAVSATIPTASVNLDIAVELSSAQTAARAANALAQAAVSLSTTDRLLTGQVVSPATVPTSPSKPHTKLILIAGLLVGLILGVVAAILVERSRPRLRSASEVAFVTGLAVIGRLPSSRGFKSGVHRALEDPIVGGAVRSLRTMLDHDARDRPVSTLLVTSSVPGEGKSTVASALALSIARLDARVLLMDADLRHPSVATVFGIKPSPGLAELLGGTATVEEAIRPVSTGLDAMPTSGLADTGDALALGLPTVLAVVQDRYDVVIIDSPPLLVGDDSGTLVTLVDGVLFVVARGTETRRLGEAASMLDALSVRVIGTVFNRTDLPNYAYSYGVTGDA